MGLAVAICENWEKFDDCSVDRKVRKNVCSKIIDKIRFLTIALLLPHSQLSSSIGIEDILCYTGSNEHWSVAALLYLLSPLQSTHTEKADEQG